MTYDNHNVLIITLDSCRWDSYERAETKNLDKYLKLRKAYSQGTFTLPSHISMYSGILPSVRENVPYYNRFRQYLFRVNVRPDKNKPFVTFPKETKNIIKGFKDKGYHTLGTGAVSWFLNKTLTSDFDEFYFSGICLDKQIKYLTNKVTQFSVPFFGLLNIGETHDPFEYGNKINDSFSTQRDRMKSFKNEGYDETLHLKQIACLEYVDDQLQYLFQSLKNLNRDTLIVICGDHGECFGEDGLYGHGFYHPKVMEVPLGIFEIKSAKS